MPAEIDRAMEMVAEALGRYSFRSASEKLLQASIAEVLAKHDLSHRREHPLPGTGTIDFYLPPARLGIEVKTKGSLADVTRQVSRYLRDDAVGGLLLVTTRHGHDALPATLHGKPLGVFVLMGGLTG